MSKQLSRPNARGLYRCEKGGHTFYLGTERQQAERRKAAIESILASLGGEWDCMSASPAIAGVMALPQFMSSTRSNIASGARQTRIENKRLGESDDPAKQQPD